MRQRLATELAVAVLEAQRARWEMLGGGALAMLGGLAGLVRLTMGVEDEEIAQVVVSILALLVVSGFALFLAARGRRRFGRARRRAEVLEAMLRGGSG